MKKDSPTEEEILQKLADLGEPCNCTYRGATALYPRPESERKRCPVHGVHDELPSMFLGAGLLKAVQARAKKARMINQARGTIIYGEKLESQRQKEA